LEKDDPPVTTAIEGNMNIFILENHPVDAAQMYCDKHVPKMVLELGQMLSTAHRLLGDYTWDGMYKEAYVNHPCTKWVRESSANYSWAASHFQELALQYELRFGKKHKTWLDHGIDLWRTPYFLSWKSLEEKKGLTPFAQAMPDEYKNECAVTAYRTYYKNDKKRFARWERGVNPPYWW